MKEPPDGSAAPDQDAPPPIPPAEMPEEALRALVDDGNVREVERALREQNVRLPAVLAELDRVLSKGLGNLAAALATMLTGSFHVARADKLAARVLEHENTAGAEELTDLAAALLQQERLTSATQTVEAALRRDVHYERAHYLRARIHARRGDPNQAFESIAKVSPKLLEAPGLALQARYAAFTGRQKALAAALKLAKKAARDEEAPYLAQTEDIVRRLSLAGVDPTQPMRLRTAMAIEYGSLVVELARDARDGGRFGLEPMKLGDVGRLVDRMIRTMRNLGFAPTELIHANEDGEIVAAAFARRLGVPYREWRADRAADPGAWLCMASAGTHPHIRHDAVLTLQQALDEGTLRTLALLLPVGWRGPMVPDLIGRLAGDDELPWLIDDEVDETVDLIFDESEETSDDALDDEEALFALVERHAGLLRAALPVPRRAHVPFMDETPVPRG